MLNKLFFKRVMVSAIIAGGLMSPAIMADYRIVIPSGGTEKTSATAGLAVSLLSSEINGHSISLNFDKDLGQAPPTSAFTVDVNGNSIGVNTISASGSTLQLGLNGAVTAEATVTLHYSDPTSANDAVALQSSSGTDVASFTQVLTNTSASAAAGPTINYATLNGSQLTVDFSEVLSGNLPPFNSFTVTGSDGRVLTTTAIDTTGPYVNTSGRQLSLTLSAEGNYQEALTLSYSDPTAYLDDSYAAQNLNGDDAPSTSLTVTNNTPAPVAPLASTISFQQTYPADRYSSHGDYIFVMKSPTHFQRYDGSNGLEDNFTLLLDGVGYGSPTSLGVGNSSSTGNISANYGNISYSLYQAITAAAQVEIVYTYSHPNFTRIADRDNPYTIPSFRVTIDMP